MQIGNYYENYTKSGTGMSAYDALQSGNVSTHNVSFKGMPQGSVFEGNVAKIKGNQVLLVLENGQSIKARLDGSVKLSLGQSMFFQVKSNENGVVSIKPYTDGVHSNPTLLKALLAAGLMTDENNPISFIPVEPTAYDLEQMINDEKTNNLLKVLDFSGWKKPFMKIIDESLKA